MSNGNGTNGGLATQSTAILVAIGVVVVAGVFSAALAHDNAGQIIGFCSLIAVSLLGLLQQARAAAKTDEVKAVLETSQAKVAEKTALVAQTLQANTTETAKAKDAALDAVKTSGANAAALEIVSRTVNGQREAMIEAARVMQERITLLEKIIAEKLQIEAVKETVKVVVAEIKANGTKP